MARKVRKSKYTAPDPNQLQQEQESKLDLKGVIKDERTRKITGAIALLIALFLFFAFSSYIFTWEEDQDQVFKEGAGILLPNDLKIANLLGALGAYMSHIFFYKGFGIASFLFCPFFAMLGINLLFAESYFSLKRNLRYTLSGLLVVSIVASFIGQSASFSWGGAVGDMICNWLIAFIGKLGTAAIIILIVFAYFIWRFNPNFKIPAKSARLKATEETPDNSDSAATMENLTKEGSGVVVILPKQKGNPEPLKQLSKNPEADTSGIALISKEDVENPDLDVLGNPVVKTVNQLYEENGGAFESGAKLTIETDAAGDNLALGATNTASLDLKDEDAFDEEDVIPTLHLNQHGRRKPDSGTADLTLEINEVDVSSLDEPSAAEAVFQMQPYEPTLDLKDYQYPEIDLLESHGSEMIIRDTTELDENKNQIIATLRNYSIEIQKISATVGPTVTLYEIVPAAGVRISRIKNLEDDIALSLAALGIRIIAPIPGKGTIGIEVPNAKKSIVSMRSLVASEKFQKNNFSLPIALGKKINNEDFIVDLASMPHLLMAGATGQGKSVGLNAILVSLLYKKHPSQLKFVLVDPKKVELSVYSIITNHFLAKLPDEEDAIITDTKKVITTLNSLCIEMDNRYDLLKEAGCRNIKEYNAKFVERRLNPQKGHQFLPFIVLVVDEFADLIMTAGKEVEMPIARLAQLARAVGIHLIIATQRPSVNIITGTIKANFPARIAFKVSSKIDSRTILDAGGAEQLIGKGDMLVSYNGDITRLQCAFVDTPEVEKITQFIGYQEGNPQVFLLPEYADEKESENKEFNPGERDALFDDAARLIVQNQVGSTSLIQRRMKLGYNRAGRLMDQLEAAGVVGPGVGSKAREVLIKTEYELEQFLDSTR